MVPRWAVLSLLLVALAGCVEAPDDTTPVVAPPAPPVIDLTLTDAAVELMVQAPAGVSELRLDAFAPLGISIFGGSAASDEPNAMGFVLVPDSPGWPEPGCTALPPASFSFFRHWPASDIQAQPGGQLPAGLYRMVLFSEKGATFTATVNWAVGDPTPPPAEATARPIAGNLSVVPMPTTTGGTPPGSSIQGELAFDRDGPTLAFPLWRVHHPGVAPLRSADSVLSTPAGECATGASGVEVSVCTGVVDSRCALKVSHHVTLGAGTYTWTASADAAVAVDVVAQADLLLVGLG